jgi:hypothetical protein
MGVSENFLKFKEGKWEFLNVRGCLQKWVKFEGISEIVPKKKLIWKNFNLLICKKLLEFEKKNYMVEYVKNFR